MRLNSLAPFRGPAAALALTVLASLGVAVLPAQTAAPAPSVPAQHPNGVPVPLRTRPGQGSVPMPGPDGVPSLPPRETAAPEPASGEANSGTVGPLKFGDLTVDAALDLLEQWTGRIVLRTQALPATSLVLSISHPISRAEAVQALETVLEVNQIGIAPMGDKFLKVTPLAQVRSEAPALIDGSTLGLPPSGRVAVKLFEFHYLTASEIMPQLATLLSPGIGAAPVIVDKANAALITDTVANLQRIERLISDLDQPNLSRLTPHFYTLTNAKASDVANSIKGLLSGSLASQMGNAVTIQPDDRTNKLIIMCDARQQAFFDQLVEKLNSPGETNTRQEVIFLKHATAKDVATLLTNLVTGHKQAAQSTGTQAQAALLQAAQRRPNQPVNGPPGAAQPPATAASLLQSIGGEGATEFSSLLTIISEDRSNSLVVSGTLDDIAIVRDLVNKLDVVLPQVRIEMLICDVSLDDEHTNGISALGLQVVAGKLVGFNGSAAGLNVSGADSTGAATTYATLGANHDLSAILGLGTTPRKTDVTVLSQPSVVATHNQESDLFVGESDPVLSSYTNTGTVTGTGSSIGTGYNTAVTYKDIGVQVKVKPLIGSDGAIEMQISIEVNDIQGTVQVDGNSQPIVTKRTTESTVSVRDGDIVVLGGLQRTAVKAGTNRLGPIPFIGDLLGTRTKGRKRDDLVFFLRPYILKNTTEDNDSTLRRLNQSKEGPAVRSMLHLDDQPAAKP